MTTRPDEAGPPAGDRAEVARGKGEARTSLEPWSGRSKPGANGVRTANRPPHDSTDLPVTRLLPAASRTGRSLIRLHCADPAADPRRRRIAGRVGSRTGPKQLSCSPERMCFVFSRPEPNISMPTCESVEFHLGTWHKVPECREGLPCTGLRQGLPSVFPPPCPWISPAGPGLQAIVAGGAAMLSQTGPTSAHAPLRCSTPDAGRVGHK